MLQPTFPAAVLFVFVLTKPFLNTVKLLQNNSKSMWFEFVNSNKHVLYWWFWWFSVSLWPIHLFGQKLLQANWIHVCICVCETVCFQDGGSVQDQTSALSRPPEGHHSVAAGSFLPPNKFEKNTRMFLIPLVTPLCPIVLLKLGHVAFGVYCNYSFGVWCLAALVNCFGSKRLINDSM